MISTRFSTVAILLTTAFLLSLSACKRTPIGHPPAAPSQPTGISNGGYNTSYEFCATATDPDSDSVAIRFSWGDGATSEWSAWVASGETANMSHVWSSASTYQIRAQAKDRPGQTSGWSESLAVRIIATHPPNTPGAPTGPSSAARDSLCTFTTIATDPDGDGVSYRFDWGTGDTSAWSDWMPGGQPASMKYAFYRGGVHQVRAQVRDVNEVRSPWSNSLSVSIPDPNPPSTPSQPVGSYAGVRDSSYAFSSSALDVDGDSVSIRFSWGDGDTSVWSQLTNSGDTALMTHAWRDTGVYDVKAQARDEDGVLSTWSSPRGMSVSAPKWYIRIGYNTGSPAIGADGTIFVGSRDSGLCAVGPDGSQRWCFHVYDGVHSPAIGPDGTIYAASRNLGYLYAFNQDGSLKWQYGDYHDEFGDLAIAADGTIYVSSAMPFDSTLYAVNPDGSLKWSWHCRSAGYILSSPAIASDGTIYVGYGDSLYAIDPDGVQKWICADVSFYGGPAVSADGTVYVGTGTFGGDELCAVSPDGTLKWRLAGPAGPPAIGVDGTIYATSFDSIYAVNPDGTLRWRYSVGGFAKYSGECPAISADGTIYAGFYGDQSGWLCAISADGTVRWRSATEGSPSSPTIATDGTVYVGAGDFLYAIPGSSPLADAPWPKFHHDNKNTSRVGGGRR